MSNSVSKNIGRGLLVAVLSLGMVGGLAYQDTAMAGASSAVGKNKHKDGFPGCCGAPATGVGNSGSTGSGGGSGGNGGGGNGGGGGGSEDQF